MCLIGKQQCMKRPCLLIFASLVFLFRCDDNPLVTTVCLTPATMVDLSGLDGCGFVLELEDGKRLEPLTIFRCGTPPISEEDEEQMAPVDWVDGKKVFIDYEEVYDMGSICMAGQIARITCIRDADPVVED
jgi:hypothetical protein